MGREGWEGGRGIEKKNLGRKLTFLSKVEEHALLMPHVECFGSVSNKYFYQKFSHSISLHIIPQGESYKDIAVRV